MIQLSGINITFGSKTIIDGIDLSVAKGETVAVLGKNGAGKTVLLKAVAALLPITNGRILINGQEISAGINLAYVFQKGGLFDSMNVFDNTAFALVRMGLDTEEIYERVMAALRRVGLKDSAQKLPSELSGGMQKRVGLARAVCMEPQIILYDDPTAGLDPVLSDSMADLILEIRDAVTATSIVVTHDLQLAKKTADAIMLLYGGKAAFSGSVNEFFSKQNEFARQFIDGDADGPIDIF
jgi:phospholipid/cholesterol/gamma-HCH transport system ATP-binding protein